MFAPQTLAFFSENTEGSMKPGRNDDCTCGSGLKYKKCCGIKEGNERMSNRLHRELEAALMERMLPFAEDVFGDEAINEALLLFLDDVRSERELMRMLPLRIDYL